MSGITPYQQIRYPLSGETIDAAAEQAMATDMDVLLDEATVLGAMGTARPAGTVSTAVNPSLVKNTLTTVTWTSGTGGFWAAGNPTRITVQAPGLYVIQTNQQLTGLSAGNVSTFRVMVARNGATTAPNIQSQMNPQWETAQIGANLFTVWAAVAGDFFEVKMLWNGSAAGPFSVGGTTLSASIFCWSYT